MNKNNIILTASFFLGISSLSLHAMNKAPERLFFTQFVAALRSSTKELNQAGFYLSETTINHLITVALSNGINPDNASISVISDQQSMAITIRERFKETCGWSQITYHDDGNYYDIALVAAELDGVKIGQQTATSINYEEALDPWRQDYE
jgi:hypothetical protein